MQAAFKGPEISIHALLAESDSPPDSCYLDNIDFYPRSPCGERREPDSGRVRHAVFLSTLSLRRATQAKALKIPTLRISIHALLAESDLLS